MKSLLPIAILSLVAACPLHAASLYVGDVAAAGQTVPAGTIGPDTSNAGAVTYAFFSAGDTYTNSSGGPQTLLITETNFYSITTGTLTPFVGVLLGAGAAGADYDVLAKGDGIAGAVGLNNAGFLVGGVSPSVVLNDGETLVAGFHQTGGNPNGMIPWEAPAGASDPDYLSNFDGANGGDNIPAGGGPLGDDANWDSLGREYRFNVGFDVVPEPSTSLLVLLPGVLLLFLRRRKR